ncbi:DUF1152 domain-containing protein [Methylosinus trichosporium]|uniref:DUF1152 domain-containing protein n=1 Tax=Methylosinus trichosporium (strain ATCC 35070 / NCIMB 11131 / UNIQEM 75 / OB3b) TaxID=595536 RepID=A0A2D2D045_METT3|nr:DUF1152 domain-containing protein [Methylosinus trichosporium]ATQ68371.1 DUF1152 domain-containing protein [Methylosinus trichosporium OB3b]
MRIPFFRELETSRRVLIAGCGGGFDIVSGLPLYVALQHQGKRVFLANLSFARVDLACPKKIGPSARLVDFDSRMQGYFPERHLVDWLAARGDEPKIFAFEKSGVRPTCRSYEALVRLLDIDTLILVDGGTDSLMKGDEAALGTIEEDALSIVAANETACPRKFLVCLGFGVDHFHGVCHHSFLENAAELIRSGGFLGCVSVSAGEPEGDALLDAVDFLNARQPSSKSIVANSIASALRGDFGDRHATERTRGSELFVNPLMSLYWCFRLEAVARKMGFYDAIAGSETFHEIESAIRIHHARVAKRDWKNLPL